MKYVYKIISALLFLAVIPVYIFAPMFTFAAKSVALQAISGSEYIADSLSFAGIFKYIDDLAAIAGNLSDGSGTYSFLLTKLIVICVFAALAMLTAVVGAVLVIVCKKKFPACCAAVMGITFTVFFTIAFGNFAQPFLDGAITLSSLANTWWVSFIASIELLFIDTPVYYIYVLFAAVLVWTAAFILTEPKKEEAVKKA